MIWNYSIQKKNKSKTELAMVVIKNKNCKISTESNNKN